jgi:hypothetical protein
MTGIKVEFTEGNLDDVISSAKAKADAIKLEIHYMYVADNELPEGASTSGEGASGYNNAKGFAGGKHSNGQYEGLAEVGELGPELFIHDG